MKISKTIFVMFAVMTLVFLPAFSAEAQDNNLQVNKSLSGTSFPMNANTPPTASFVVTPTEGFTTTIFSFDASNSSDVEDSLENLIVRWDWENDGIWDLGWTTPKTATHRYTEPGVYTVKLEVRDLNGLIEDTTLNITVLLSHTYNVPSDYSTIQSAIDLASDGDTVLVQSGTYTENINFHGKNIIVGSLFITTGDTSYISQTIIDGNSSESVVTFNSGEDSTALLSGFTITNGSGNGAGIYCYSSSPILRNVIISGNMTLGSGGGISCNFSSPTLTNVTISGNKASGNGGGGIYCEDNSSPSLTNVTITGNTAERGGGGGIWCKDLSSPSLTNVIINGNTARGSSYYSNGGGIYCENNSSPSLTNVTISGNTASRTGGGISCYYSSSPILMNVTISGNTADSDGGGIYCDASNSTLSNVTISGNSTNYYGGGIYCNSSSLSLTKVTINGNTATSGGGGICCSSSSMNLTNVIINGNTTASGGGGICCSSSSMNLSNMTISGNSTNYYGGGISCYYSSSMNLTNMTISGNTASSGGGGIYCRNSSSPNLVNSILWNNSPQEIYFYSTDNPNSITIVYSDVQGGESGIITNDNGTVNWMEGSFNADPQFKESGQHPYELSEFSICINVGNPDTTGLNLPLTDLAGYPRISEGRIDMGAYEYQGFNTPPVAEFSIVPDSGTTSTHFYFNASSSSDNEDDLSLLKVRWDWENDGIFDTDWSTIKTATHQYSNTGIYTIKLEVKDTGYLIDDNANTITVFKSEYPHWDVNPIAFEHNITMSLKLIIDEEISTDSTDVVAAFVGEECRGVGSPAYFPVTGDYVVNLMIYSNISGDTVTFKAFDNSNYQIYNADTTITFIPDANLGTANNPIDLNCWSYIDINVPLHHGWTYFSLNIFDNDMTLNNVLSSLLPAEGDLIKNQVGFSTYYNGTGWWGDLEDISCKDMYMIKLSSVDTLRFKGLKYEISDIPLNEGWTWIGYLPQTLIAIDEALSSLSAAEGDLIKNQTGFSMYYGGYGWWGDIDYMKPFDGYKIKLSSADTLLYPQGVGKTAVEPIAQINGTSDISQTKWSVTPSDHANTMTMTAQLSIDDEIVNDTGYIVGVFAAEECRSIGAPIYFPPTDSYVIPLTIYSNEEEETLTFKVITTTGIIINIKNACVSCAFQADNNVGNAINPFMLNGSVSETEETSVLPKEFALYNNYPNPFNPETNIKFQVPKASFVKLKIYGTAGQLIKTLVYENFPAGVHSVVWDGTNVSGVQVSSGVYLYKIEAGGFSAIKKMMFLK